jgi:hypothetical protein
MADRQKIFQMRTDTDEGAEFLDALDRLRDAEKPKLDRSAMLKKLVFEAQKRLARSGR